MFDPEAFGAAMADVVKAATAPLIARLDALESAIKAADVERLVEDAFKSLPSPKQGEKGERGDVGLKGETGPRGASVTSAIIDGEGILQLTFDDGQMKAVGRVIGPVGPRGEKGDKGEKGDRGEVGDRGEKGQQGDRGERGEAGVSIKGEKGDRGVGVSGAMIDRDGSLLVTFEDGQVKSLGCVVGKDGQDGKAGADGVSFEHFELAYDAEANEMIVSAQAGGKKQVLRHPVSGLNARGYWRDGIKAKAGEGYSLDGSLYIANRDTGARPSPTAEDWTLSARRGRDGENGKSAPGHSGPVNLKVS